MSESMETVEMLRAESIFKSYGEHEAVADVSLSISKGEIHGILGPVGAGKTTLMEILSGSISADSGSVRMSGNPVGIGEKAVKARIGYMPERNSFFADMTVGEILNFVGDAKGVVSEKRYRQIKEALDLVGLSERQNRLVGHLSGEEIKRLSLAAALLGNPDILLLDEPIPSVSAEKKEEFFGVIRMLGRIKTVVLATADYSTAKELCDDVTILSDGKILVQGSFAALDDKLRQNESATTLEAVYRELVSVSVKPPRMLKDTEERTGWNHLKRKNGKEDRA